MGKLLKGLVTLTAATAAVGGLCYVFKDQIKESKIYKDYDVDEKIKKVKNTINENETFNKVKDKVNENETFNKVKDTLKEKMPKVFDNEADYVDEGEIFFDDLDPATSDRDYVSLDAEDKSETDDTADAEPVTEG
ncbi:MAG: hypothetical protein IJV15_03845 [Lachnospiraceae bacterium]|nr:hypothetical protein [Lachnospiraceae bacterium]